MKKISIIFIFFFISGKLSAQNMVAQYEVKKTIKGASKDLNVPPVNLTCYYYKKGNRIISFLKADYLKEYPNAILRIETGENNGQNFSLYSDSIQGISYFDLDSMILRTRVIGGLESNDNRWYYFESNYRRWNIFPDSLNLQGMECKRAIELSDNGSPIAEIWFNPEIPMPVGMRNLINVPGLIVKATYYGTSETFTLKSFSTTEDIPDSVFWPKEFNEPFKKQSDLRLKK